MPLQKGLDVAREIHHVREAVERLDFAGRPLQGLQQATAPVPRRLRALLMAANATQDFAGHDTGEALHPLYGQIVFVQRHEKTTDGGRAPRNKRSHPLPQAPCPAPVPA